MLMAAAQGAAAVGARQPERKRKASRGNFTGERAYPSSKARQPSQVSDAHSTPAARSRSRIRSSSCNRSPFRFLDRAGIDSEFALDERAFGDLGAPAQFGLAPTPAGQKVRFGEAGADELDANRKVLVPPADWERDGGKPYQGREQGEGGYLRKEIRLGRHHADGGKDEDAVVVEELIHLSRDPSPEPERLEIVNRRDHQA